MSVEAFNPLCRKMKRYDAIESRKKIRMIRNDLEIRKKYVH